MYIESMTESPQPEISAWSACAVKDENEENAAGLGTLQSRPTTARRRSIVERLDVGSPLLRVEPLHAAIIGHEAVDLAFDIGRLRPDAAAAGEPTRLVLQFGEEDVAAVVPDLECVVDFVCLVDSVDGGLVVPQAASVSGYLRSQVPYGHTVQSRHCAQCRRTRPESRSGSGQTGWKRESKRGFRIAGWRSGGCPAWIRICGSTLSRLLTLKSPAP